MDNKKSGSVVDENKSAALVELVGVEYRRYGLH
jgi:hypothetical protein